MVETTALSLGRRTKILRWIRAEWQRRSVFLPLALCVGILLARSLRKKLLVLLRTLEAKRHSYRLSGEPGHGQVTTPLYKVKVDVRRLSAANGSALYTMHYQPTLACTRQQGGPLTRPTLLLRTPYGADAFSGFFAQIFAERGYHVVVQDVRGRFGSGGEFSFLENERDDGLAAIDWICKQPWCLEGKIALFGMSYDGYDAFAALAGELAHMERTGNTKTRVSAVAVIRCTSDLGKRGMYQHGAFCLEVSARFMGLMLKLHNSKGTGFFSRLSTFHSIFREFVVQSGPRWEKVERHVPVGTLVEAVEDFNGQKWNLSKRIVEIRPNPEDSYWEDRDHSVALAQMRGRAPVHLMGGWFDIFIDAQLADYETLQAAAEQAGAPLPWLTVGPWTHFDSFEPDLKHSLDFFDMHLKKAEDLQEPQSYLSKRRELPVRVFLLGLGEEHVTQAGVGAQEELGIWHRVSRGVSSAMCPSGDPRLAHSDQHPGWRSFVRWPPPEASPVEVALILEATLLFDPTSPTPAIFGARFSPTQSGRMFNSEMENRDDVVVVTSLVLHNPLEIVGRPAFRVGLYCNTPSCDLFVRLCDVDQQDQSRIVCDGIASLRTSPANESESPKSTRSKHLAGHRRVSVYFDESLVKRTPSSLDRLGSQSRARQVVSQATPEAFAEVQVLDPTAAYFAAGHRLRLCISGGAFPRFLPNCGLGEPLATAEQRSGQTLTLSAAESSFLELPVLGGSAALSRAFGLAEDDMEGKAFLR